MDVIKDVCRSILQPYGCSKLVVTAVNLAIKIQKESAQKMYAEVFCSLMAVANLL